jgi:hypothetical protein
LRKVTIVLSFETFCRQERLFLAMSISIDAKTFTSRLKLLLADWEVWHVEQEESVLSRKLKDLT